MNKISYPGFEEQQQALRRAQEVREEKLAAAAKKKAAKEAKKEKKKAAKEQEKAERQERRECIRTYSKVVPLFPKECKDAVNDFMKGFMPWYCLIWAILSLWVLKNFDSENKDCTPELAVALYFMGIAYAWLLKWRLVRRTAICNAAKAVEKQEKNFEQIFGDPSEEKSGITYDALALDCCYHYKWAHDIGQSMWREKFASNPLYFDVIMHSISGQKNKGILTDSGYAGGVQAIIENHLKTHPSDIERVKEVFDVNTIPKKLLERCEKQKS